MGQGRQPLRAVQLQHPPRHPRPDPLPSKWPSLLDLHQADPRGMPEHWTEIRQIYHCFKCSFVLLRFQTDILCYLGLFQCVLLAQNKYNYWPAFKAVQYLCKTVHCLSLWACQSKFKQCWKSTWNWLNAQWCVCANGSNRGRNLASLERATLHLYISCCWWLDTNEVLTLYVFWQNKAEELNNFMLH